MSSPTVGGSWLSTTVLNRMVLTKALSADGHTSVTAETGCRRSSCCRRTAAVRRRRALDLEMPVLDGYETLARMKSDERLRHLPVIVVSSIEDLDSVVRCIKIGATDYLPRPFNAEVLRARLTRPSPRSGCTTSSSGGRRPARSGQLAGPAARARRDRRRRPETVPR